MEIQKIVTGLPVSQQMALWVILNMQNVKENNFSFLSSDFISKFNSFERNYKLSVETATNKSVGGLLSALMRNDILIKLSGDRDKLWTLPNEIKGNLAEYKIELANIRPYWS